MLTICTFRSMVRPVLLTMLLSLGMMIPLMSPAFAEEKKTSMVLLLEPNRDDYSYRQTNKKKVISIMLYGFNQSDGVALTQSPSILKDKKALSSFFADHLARVKRDYFGQDGTQTFNLVAGGEAFNSMPLNRGPGLEPAKMAGVTFPMGKFTLGGGYTWGEKNPAMMRLTKAEGLFAGASYDVGTTRFQVSYLTSGQEVMGLEIGGTDIRYDSVMFGTSFRINKAVGFTTTIQYRSDKDPLTTGENQVIFTAGTKWKF